jgi:hypothetical protein
MNRSRCSGEKVEGVRLESGRVQRTDPQQSLGSCCDIYMYRSGQIRVSRDVRRAGREKDLLRRVYWLTSRRGGLNVGPVACVHSDRTDFLPATR